MLPTYIWTSSQEEVNKVCASALTEDSGHEAEGKVWREGGEEPRRGVQAGPDLLLLEVAVEIPVVVVEQPRQLVHLNLTWTTQQRLFLGATLRAFIILYIVLKLDTHAGLSLSAWDAAQLLFSSSSYRWRLKRVKEKRSYPFLFSDTHLTQRAKEHKHAH